MQFQIIDSNYGLLYTAEQSVRSKVIFSFREMKNMQRVGIIFYTSSNNNNLVIEDKMVSYSISPPVMENSVLLPIDQPTNYQNEYIIKTTNDLFLNLDCSVTTTSPIFILSNVFDPMNYTYLLYRGYSSGKHNYILTSKKCPSIKWTLSINTNPTISVPITTNDTDISISSNLICSGECGGDCFGICSETNRRCVLGPYGHECDLITKCSYCGPCYYPTGRLDTICKYVGGTNSNKIYQEVRAEEQCPNEIDLTKSCNYKLDFPDDTYCPGRCASGDCVAIVKDSINQYMCQDTKKISTGAIIALVIIGLILISVLIWVIIFTTKKNKATDGLVNKKTIMSDNTQKLGSSQVLPTNC